MSRLKEEEENMEEQKEVSKPKGRFKKHLPLSKFSIELPPNSKNFIGQGGNLVRIEKEMGSDCSKYLQIQKQYMIIKYKKEEQLEIGKKLILELIDRYHKFQPIKYFKRLYQVPNLPSPLLIEWKQYNIPADIPSRFKDYMKYSLNVVAQGEQPNDAGEGQKEPEEIRHHASIKKLGNCMKKFSSFLSYQITKNPYLKSKYLDGTMTVHPKISFGRLLFFGSQISSSHKPLLSEVMTLQKPSMREYWYFSHFVPNEILKIIQQSEMTRKLKDDDVGNNIRIVTIQSKKDRKEQYYYALDQKETSLIDGVVRNFNIFEDILFPTYSCDKNKNMNNHQTSTDLRIRIQTRSTILKVTGDEEKDEELIDENIPNEIQDLLFDEDAKENENWIVTKNKSRRVTKYSVEKFEDITIGISHTTNHLNDNFQAYEVDFRSKILEDYLVDKKEEYQAKDFLKIFEDFVRKVVELCNLFFSGK